MTDELVEETHHLTHQALRIAGVVREAAPGVATLLERLVDAVCKLRRERNRLIKRRKEDRQRADRLQAMLNERGE